MNLILREDTDRVLSYNTKQQVNILDRNLGFTNMAITCLVIFYIVGYDLFANKGYFMYETARGVVATHMSGDAYAMSSFGKHRYFSAEEISYPGLENGNAFVATRMSFRHQSRGICEDMNMPCESDDDCTPGKGECTDNGFCMEPAWCEQPTEDGQLLAEVYELPVSEQLVWVKSAIQYIRLDPMKLFMTDMTQPVLFPEPGFNTFSVRNLLEICETKVRYEEISELGAAIEVQLIYNCDVADTICNPEVKARRLDNIFDPEKIGFSFKYPSYEGGGLQRDEQRSLIEVQGLRIYIRAHGTGRKVSMVAIIMKLSTGLALMGMAPIVVDTIMLNFFSLRDKYYARKYIESEDFSDFFNTVNIDDDDKRVVFGDDEDANDSDKEDDQVLA